MLSATAATRMETRDAGRESLALYHYEGCPYCDVVRDAARELGVTLESRDIEAEPRHLRDLLAARGRRTVPVLRIARDGASDEWMPESQDIVRYLEQRAGRTVKRSLGPLGPWTWAALALGVLSIALSLAGVVDTPWWYGAIVVAVVVLARVARPARTNIS